MRDHDGAPIFPFVPSNSSRLYGLDELLEAFWGENKAQAWSKLYKNPAITQSLANYLSLNRQLCFWLGKARFAFKPLSKTATTITLQFHWLRRTNLWPTSPIYDSGETLADFLRTPPATWGSYLAHRASGVPIQTGQTFVIRAENPKDLPNFELLELQWNLHRVAAICGAPDVPDVEDDE